MFLFDQLKEISKFHTKWQIREEEYRKIILTDTLEIHIIELPKLKKQLKENKLDKKDKVAIWSTFLLNPENVGDEIMDENEDIKLAKEELEKIKKDKQEQRLAELRMKHILDQNSIRNSGIREGMEKGIKQGIKQGIEQGKKEGEKYEKIKIAKKLIELKMSIEQIIEITGLTEEEIKNIK